MDRNVLREQVVLRLDPAHRRGELMREKLDENGVCKLLALLRHAYVPVLEDLRETRRRGLVVDELGVVLGDLERLGDEVGIVFPSSMSGSKCSALTFFERST